LKDDNPVLLDACVLIPMPLADTLLRLAAGPRLFLPKWSGRIMAEVSRTLQENFGLSHQKTMYRESEIRRHFPEAWIEGYEDSMAAMTCHPKDRHVLAAAVCARAKTIVTYNIKDFPNSSLAPYSIAAQGPSAFLKKLHERSPLAVMRNLEALAEAIGQTMPYLLSRLRINAPSFVATIEDSFRTNRESDDMSA